MYSPWRWRDEHTERATYYDGTPVTGPFNPEFMEGMLMMKAYGIPNGVYWIDRPWGPGIQGYDDFEIDSHRLPNFAESVNWLHQQHSQMLLWIAADGVSEAVSPWFVGRMRDVNGRYFEGFLALIGVALLGALAVSTLPMRRRAA